MRRSNALALALLGILGCAALTQIYGKRADHAVAALNPRGNNTLSQLNVVAERAANPTASLDATQNRQLREKLARLEARIDQLAKQPTQKEARDEPPWKEPPSLTYEQRIERNHSRIRRIDEALDHEPHDGRWSADTSRVLEELFVSVVPPGSSLSETTCGETFCRLIVKHENQKARDEFEVFPRKVPGMGVRGLIEHHDDGTEQTTLYVVRKEYDTPEHPVRLQDSTG